MGRLELAARGLLRVVTGEERVFVRTDAVPIVVPRLSGRDLRRWQARLWPDHVYYRWT